MAQAAQGAELVRRAARKRPRRNRHRRRGQEGRLPRSSSRVGAAAAALSARLPHTTGPQHTDGTPTLHRLQAQPRHPPRPIRGSQSSERTSQTRHRGASLTRPKRRHREASASLTRPKRRPTALCSRRIGRRTNCSSRRSARRMPSSMRRGASALLIRHPRFHAHEAAVLRRLRPGGMRTTIWIVCRREARTRGRY